jgi:hypothetical protein
MKICFKKKNPTSLLLRMIAAPHNYSVWLQNPNRTGEPPPFNHQTTGVPPSFERRFTTTLPLLPKTPSYLAGRTFLHLLSSSLAIHSPATMKPPPSWLLFSEHHHSRRQHHHHPRLHLAATIVSPPCRSPTPPSAPPSTVTATNEFHQAILD